MKKTIFSEKLQHYLDTVKATNINIKSDEKAITYLIEKMNEATETPISLSTRAVRKWLNGETYPDAEKLVILSTIFDCTIDELLKDRTTTLQLNEALPLWYQELSESSKKIMLKLLENCRTGNRNRIYWEIFDDHIWRGNNMDISPSAISMLFFPCTLSEKSVQIHGDLYYTAEDIREKELNLHKEKEQRRILEQYLTACPDINQERVAETILKLIDIGYSDFSGWTRYWNEPIPGEKWGLTVDHLELMTDNWNEIAFRFEDETNNIKAKLYENLTENGQKQLEYNIDIQTTEIKEKVFYELLDKGLITFEQRGFFRINFRDKEQTSSRAYFCVKALLNIDEKDIIKILVSKFRKELNSNINYFRKEAQDILHTRESFNKWLQRVKEKKQNE